MTCKHVTTYTEENRAAHGNRTYTVECVRCGAQRLENRNGLHVEFGVWGPDVVERENAADREAVAESHRQYMARRAGVSS